MERDSLIDVELFIYFTLQGSITYLTMAAASKVVAVATTYPYQVVRARLQV